MTYVKTYLPMLKMQNLKRDTKDLSRDLQQLEVRGKLGSITLYYHFAIHAKYTFKMVRKMRQGSPRKPIRVVYRTTFKNYVM